VNPIYYPTVEKIIELNALVLTVIKVKKADKSVVLSTKKIYEAIENCKTKEGDIYDKAAFLLESLIKNHPFASGNRRTAFIATKDFLFHNNHKFNVKDDPSQARVMTGIREHFYTHEEIKEWVKHGKIKEFKR